MGRLRFSRALSLHLCLAFPGMDSASQRSCDWACLGFPVLCDVSVATGNRCLTSLASSHTCDPTQTRSHSSGLGKITPPLPKNVLIRETFPTAVMLQEGGLLPGPESGLLSNSEMNCPRRCTHADKAKDFIGKGRLGGEQQGKGTRENCSATWLAVSGFMVMRLGPVLSLANHLAWPIFGPTHGPSWWRVPLSAKMDSSKKDSGWLVGYIMGWRLLHPSGPSQILRFQRRHHVPYMDPLL